MNNVVFRGSTLECLAHYLKRLPPSTSRAGIAARTPIVQFCQCARQTIRDWTLGQPPIGTNLIRVRYFLVADGYAVSEIEKLHPLVRELGQLLAYGVLSLDAIRQEMGYSNTKDVLATLHGKQRPNNFEQRISRLVNKYRPSIAQRLRDNQHIHSIPAPAASRTSPTGRRPEAKPSIVGSHPIDKRSVVESLAALIRAGLPLAELIESDVFSDQDRRQLRVLTGQNGVFRLANILNRLCGEEARAQLRASSTSTIVPKGQRK